MYKKKLGKLDIGLVILSTLGIIVAINFFSFNIFTRFDLTENKDYSLSDISKKTARELSDIVNIKIYFSSNLPANYISLRQDVEDIVKDYANYSNGKIKQQVIDPGSDEKIKEELYFMGIPEVQFNVLEKDKYEVINGYLGIAIKYGEKTEVIPVIENTMNLEYDLTLAIKKATSARMPTIGIAENPINKMEIARNKLSDIYSIASVNLDDDSTSLEGIDTLLIRGFDHELPNESLIAINNHAMEGKSIIFLIDGVVINEGLVAAPNNTNLIELIKNYGVIINKDLVLDASSGFTSFSQGFMSFTVNYPFWPKITEQGFNSENVAVSKLEGLVLPWASSLSLADNTISTITYLTKTSPRSWTKTGQIDLSPTNRGLSIPTETTMEHVMAYYIGGRLPSAFGDEVSESTRVIVVGDSDFVTDRSLNQHPENLLFFQNIVDYVSIDEDLINIRSKGVTNRPIKDVNDATRQTIRYINIFGVTLAVICYGMLRYYIRRKKQY